MRKFQGFAHRTTHFGAWAVVSAAVLFSLPGHAEAGGRSAPAAPAAAPACTGDSVITKKLPGGTTWRMCWRNSPTAGLVLTHVTYQPRHESKPIEVLGSARLAQINVPYDDGSDEYNDVTDERFGEGALPIKAADCPGGTVRSFRVADVGTVKGLCVTTQPRGFAYHGDSGDVGEGRARIDSAQGQDLVVYTLHAVGWYHYVTQWNFSDDGTITAKEGATGNLSGGDFNASDGTGWPVGQNGAAKALSHQHSVLWRLDFKPGGSWKSKVEQYDTTTNGTNAEMGHGQLKTSRKQMTKEFAGDNANDRWWRVVASASRNADGHPRSWEIVHNRSDKYTRHAYTRHDVYVSQYKACEQYASDNRRINPDCLGNVAKYVNGENLTRPVVWVNVGFHHIARDEDQTPMPVHWQGFQIVPRDATDMSPLTPDRLHRPEFNGHN
ncbi:copper amine oxidase [Streptomyces sporangiiformans]|uniref:Amine oxidase n=1 Tax=Streptomyces sporangiiformans TaxID=2315329 RepID=A0A505DIK0_9ACTN|nr:copper amine oxidase [Streptomyces sporangiiformans]TPQ21735.1 copper amine oxidase [Streptomyces sporangiiformans]